MTLIYLDGLNGINYHRLMTPFLRLKEEEDLEIHFIENFNDLKEFDLSKVKNLVGSRRFSVSNHKAFKQYLVDNDVKLILDNDDYWKLPKDNPAYEYYKNHQSKERYLSHESVHQQENNRIDQGRSIEKTPQ